MGLVGSEMCIRDSSHAEIKFGVSYNRAAGVSHNVINDTDAEIAFVEVEIKG